MNSSPKIRISEQNTKFIWMFSNERTKKKNEFSFGSLLAYSYLFPKEKIGCISEKPKYIWFFVRFALSLQAEIEYCSNMMNKNEKFVITINRELGSGGRTVGRKLAEKLGVEFCDKTVIKGLQQKYNLSVEEIEKQKGQSNSWWAEVRRAMNIAPGVVGSVEYVEARANNGVYPPTTDEMFQTETMMLQEMAEQESFVVAGRSGFYIFRNHPNHVSILIQASMPFRVERVMRKQGLTEEEAHKVIEQVDKMRENYVNKYTKTSRYDTRNYDLVISADGKTEDELVAIILKFIG